MENIMKQLLGMRCPPPWQAQRHLCLMYRPEDKTWPDANQFCKKYGGVLAWIQDRAEHDIVTAFVKRKIGEYRGYWIGLHRSGGALQWAGSSGSSYRGESLVDAQKDYFEAKTDTRKFLGWNKKLEFLCRRG